MNCLIITGGEFSKTLPKKKYDLIIACDKGYQYAKKLHIKPNIIIGDFDSAAEPKSSAFVISVDSEKDDTDTGLAIKYAIRSGYKDIDIICALGNRLDHTLANISLLKYIIEHGGKGRIISDGTEMIARSAGLLKIEKKKNSYLSIFSISDKSKIEYIKGTKYDIQNVTLHNGFPLGVSNEFKNKYAYIKIKNGIVLVCIVKDK